MQQGHIPRGRLSADPGRQANLRLILVSAPAGFGKSTCLHADGKFIILDEDGTLGLATATPEKFEVLAKSKVLGERAWTVPTLVGKTLYLRDSKQIVALDLG